MTDAVEKMSGNPSAGQAYRRSEYAKKKTRHHTKQIAGGLGILGSLFPIR